MSTSKKLLSSYCVPNVPVYVCLVGNITPRNLGNKSTDGCESPHSRLSRPSLHIINNVVGEVGTSKDDDTSIEVQRSVAFHELEKLGNLDYYRDKIEEVASEQMPLPQHEDDNSEDDNYYVNPRIMGLTKTKWLSDSRDGSPDARKSLLLSTSESSVVESLPENYSNHKALSTVLALDKEHNLFGLSNTYIARRNTWNKPKGSGVKAVFHQTAIVQTCYKTCCKRRSNTDLPSSLKCGVCRSTCCCGKCVSKTSCSLGRPSCSCCSGLSSPYAFPCSPCKVPCRSFYRKPCPAKPCNSKPCCSKPCNSKPSCSGCCTSFCKECPRYGLQVSVYKKPKYDPVYTEIEPRSSCILSKPLLARSCNHSPRCIPPSSCFPYLMPCFWPARAGAPCSEPARCFHNPPCPRGRAPRSPVDPKELCPHGHPCTGKDKTGKCENLSCIGRNNQALAKAIAEYNQAKQPASQKKVPQNQTPATEKKPSQETPPPGSPQKQFSQEQPPPGSPQKQFSQEQPPPGSPQKQS